MGMKKRRFDKLIARVPRELVELRDHAQEHAWWKNDSRNRREQLYLLAREMQSIGASIQAELDQTRPNLTEPEASK